MHVLLSCVWLDHRCKKPGCGKVFILDGNMKNHRDVCYATEAGYAGLPGRIKTGCPNTPGFQSRYCSLHTRVSYRQSLSFSENDEPENDDATKEETQALQILESKSLRSSTLFKTHLLSCYMRSNYIGQLAGATTC